MEILVASIKSIPSTSFCVGDCACSVAEFESDHGRFVQRTTNNHEQEVLHLVDCLLRFIDDKSIHCAGHKILSKLWGVPGL